MQLEDVRAVVWQYERHVDTLARARCMRTHEKRRLEEDRKTMEAQVAASAETSRMFKQALDENEHECRARAEADRRQLRELERQCVELTTRLKECGGEDWTRRDAQEVETRLGHDVTARNEEELHDHETHSSERKKARSNAQAQQGATATTLDGHVRANPVERERVETRQAVDRTTAAWLESQAAGATQAPDASHRFQRLHEQCEALETQLLSMEDRRPARIEVQRSGGFLPVNFRVVCRCPRRGVSCVRGCNK
ncbi:hypothetical protein PsorP6_011138 [Peronosclerospora sorghi]|uniref:Uncharacterized protein n=1 Tax=Peronosclerospora sorghi TaxID=230839 RepID=A0ACC0VVA4_9STRA|nr:hypothetical protein PsorP6_011138 [Peronosclerospora sorghi]